MPAVKSDKMTIDAFLAWCETQEERYELVDGVPQMMTGARKAHDRIMRRALRRLEDRLEGGPCEPFSDDIAVEIGSTNVLRPDVVVDCGDRDGSRLTADKPVLVIEVLSKSTRSTDLLRKSIQYKTVPTLRYLLFLETEQVAGAFFSRNDDGHWSDMWLVGRDTPIDMPEINVSLTLGDFYEADTP